MVAAAVAAVLAGPLVDAGSVVDYEAEVVAVVVAVAGAVVVF